MYCRVGHNFVNWCALTYVIPISVDFVLRTGANSLSFPNEQGILLYTNKSETHSGQQNWTISIQRV